MEDTQIKTVRPAKEGLNQFKNGSVDVLVVSTNFHPSEKYDHSTIDLNDEAISQRLLDTKAILHSGFRILKDGGLLFVYGLPKWLPPLAVFLDSLENASSKMIFKNWIALDLDQRPRKETLPPAHTGLLLYLKSRKDNSPSPFHLNTKTVRIPYKACKACGKNIKDWGGKKHLLNPLGAAVSDVWSDLPRIHLRENIIQEDVLKRIYRLVEKEKINFVHAIESKANNDFRAKSVTKSTITKSHERIDSYNFDIDVVLYGDSLEYMRRLLKVHPDGVFDLALADPPYNLEKGYTHYKDSLSDRKYIKWSETWLDLMSKIVRPGGALFVLNLPKYCTHYANFLNQRMDFRHWIVWDAMSTPAGKIMPAHYSLLYYTKPGGPITFNYSSKNTNDANILSPLDADYYCLRISCIKKRKMLGDDDKMELNDIWWNIHRIKHKKYRDQHPCQLPVKLMERIIKLSTNPDDVVFDPFCGAGTTAIAARKTGRHFVTLDIDKRYVSVAKKNLERMQPTLTGNYYLPREPKHYERSEITKKEVEIGYIELCKKKGRVIKLKEVKSLNPDLFEKITTSYKDFKTLKKIAHRRLEIHSVI